MANNELLSVSIEQVTNRSIVSLKVLPDVADEVAQRLSLCVSMRIDLAEPGSLWVSPGCWLMTGANGSAGSLLSRCAEQLDDRLHLAIDMTDGLSIISVAGNNASKLLSSACGLDLRRREFPVGMCCRTRFAQVPVFVARIGDEHFELIVDRSYSRYLTDWLDDTSRISLVSD